MYDVLKAFKSKDPNGNGSADEIPMMGRGIANYVINAYQYYDNDYPAEFMFSFFPEGISEDFSNVSYHYKAQKGDKGVKA